MFSQSLSKKVGERLGFFTSLMIFSSIMYFVGSKFIHINASYISVISLVIALHIAYSLLKEAVKK